MFPKGHCAHGSFGRSVSRYTQPTDFTGKDANHLKAWERIRNDLTWVDSDNRGEGKIRDAGCGGREAAINIERVNTATIAVAITRRNRTVRNAEGHGCVNKKPRLCGRGCDVVWLTGLLRIALDAEDAEAVNVFGPLHLLRPRLGFFPRLV